MLVAMASAWTARRSNGFTGDSLPQDHPVVHPQNLSKFLLKVCAATIFQRYSHI